MNRLSAFLPVLKFPITIRITTTISFTISFSIFFQLWLIQNITFNDVMVKIDHMGGGGYRGGPGW